MMKIVFIIMIFQSAVMAEWKMVGNKDGVFIYDTKTGAVWGHDKSKGGKSFSSYIFVTKDITVFHNAEKATKFENKKNSK